MATNLAVLLINLMRADSAISSIVSTRMYRLRAPQQTPVPYLLVSMPTHNVVSHLRGEDTLEKALVRFDMYGRNFMQLDTLRDALISMMSTSELKSLYTFGTELYEDDTQYFHLVADFSVWHDRS